MTCQCPKMIIMTHSLKFTIVADLIDSSDGPSDWSYSPSDCSDGPRDRSHGPSDSFHGPNDPWFMWYLYWSKGPLFRLKWPIWWINRPLWSLRWPVCKFKWPPNGSSGPFDESSNLLMAQGSWQIAQVIRWFTKVTQKMAQFILQMAQMTPGRFRVFCDIFLKGENGVDFRI